MRKRENPVKRGKDKEREEREIRSKRERKGVIGKAQERGEIFPFLSPSL